MRSDGVSNLYQLWNSPTLFIATLLVLAVGLYLGTMIVIWGLKGLVRLKFRYQQRKMRKGFIVLRGEVQDRLFDGLDELLKNNPPTWRSK
ncbi:membrane protein [Mycobacterium phage ScoobyDoobyDoo]|nr:membrane protein [Mycobacterium phage ScoobyDoobyDoo]